ncbi:MAG: hypothetical protein ABI345_02155, partial [Jatrophihabitans sp.]
QPPYNDCFAHVDTTHALADQLRAAARRFPNTETNTSGRGTPVPRISTAPQAEGAPKTAYRAEINTQMIIAQPNKYVRPRFLSPTASRSTREAVDGRDLAG